jgi:uncharacterized protein YodC (DUF2158 family)
MTIIAGDKVRLKSGGPAMMVIGARLISLGERECECTWFSRNGLFKDKAERAFFHERSLELVRADGSILPEKPLEAIRSWIDRYL